MTTKQIAALSEAIAAAVAVALAPPAKAKAPKAKAKAFKASVKAEEPTKTYGLPFLRKSVRNMIGHRRFDKFVGRRAITESLLSKAVALGVKEIAAYDAKFGTNRLASMAKANCYRKVAAQLGVKLTVKAPAKRKATKKASKAPAKATSNGGKVEVEFTK